MWVHLPLMSTEHTQELMASLFSSLKPELLHQLLRVQAALAESSIAAQISLSLRQLLRICRRVSVYPSHEELGTSQLVSQTVAFCLPPPLALLLLCVCTRGSRCNSSSNVGALHAGTNARSVRQCVDRCRSATHSVVGHYVCRGRRSECSQN